MLITFLKKKIITINFKLKSISFWCFSQTFPPRHVKKFKEGGKLIGKNIGYSEKKKLHRTK